MELVKNKLSTTILKTSKYSQFTINDDFNVPDDTPIDRKSTRLNSSHYQQSRMPSSA